MELSDYLAILRRSARLFWGIVIVVTIAAVILTVRQPTRTEGSLTATVFQVVPAQTEATFPYQFDSFYTLQAAGLYAEQLKALLADPGYVAQVFASANLELPVRRLAPAARIFTTRKLDPAAVQVTFEAIDHEQVAAVLSAVADQLTGTTTQAQANGAIGNIRLEVSQPYLISYRGSTLTAAAVAFSTSALAAVTLIFLLEFARPRRA